MLRKNRNIATRQMGFTLIELMIVVAVVGILSAIAYPSYAEYIRRGHRADARTGLLQAAQWMERAATATGVYPTALPNAIQWRDSAGNPLVDKRYTIGLAAGNTNAAFTLVATRTNPGAQATDRCGDFTLTNTGIRDANNLTSGSTAVECWGK